MPNWKGQNGSGGHKKDICNVSKTPGVCILAEKSRCLIEIGIKMLQVQCRIWGTKLRLYLMVLRHSIYIVCVWGRTSIRF